MVFTLLMNTRDHSQSEAQAESTALRARLAARERLLAHIDQHDAGGYSEEAFAELGQLVEVLRPLTAVPAPMDSAEKVEGRWDTLFAHFGARHSAGKPKVHDSNLKVQSFNCFPAVPIRVERICQEISRAGEAYNNVIDFLAADGVTRGLLIVHGRYREAADNRQRFSVDFHQLELRPAAGLSEAALRAALGFGAEEPLTVDLKPPRLHSDVVYLDDDLRINVGSLGGLYVLRRSAAPPASI